MAAAKKYAGLPDLDAAPEIYETPELTDDASTAQTSTLRTESPTHSVDGKTEDDNFDRARLNRDEARRKFEPAVVDATGVNFSDTVSGNRRSYRTAHRRRRRVRRDDGVEEIGDFSDESDVEESLAQRLARLQRETEEVRLQLEKREQDGEDSEFEDSMEHQNGHQEEEDIRAGVEEVSQILNKLKVNSRSTYPSLEAEFKKRLAEDTGQRSQQQPSKTDTKSSSTSVGAAPSSISAITAFADRLTALETTLGVSSISATETMTLLPTISTLTSQVSLLSSTLSQPRSATPTTSPSQAHLDALSARLKSLHSEADELTSARRAAIQALNDFHETRIRNTRATNTLAKYIGRREPRDRRSYLTDDTENSRSPSDLMSPSKGDKANSQEKDRLIEGTEEEQILSSVFLDEQKSKITALYNTLPTIESLQPLLPVVLERLRGLSVVHAGAATAEQDMQDLEQRLKDWEGELEKWREAVEGVERGIEESKEIMKENVDVMSSMVQGVEDRLNSVQREQRK